MAFQVPMLYKAWKYNKIWHSNNTSLSPYELFLKATWDVRDLVKFLMVRYEALSIWCKSYPSTISQPRCFEADEETGKFWFYAKRNITNPEFTQQGHRAFGRYISKVWNIVF